MTTATVPLGGAAAALGAGAASTLTVERTTMGGVRVTCPTAPGWCATPRTPIELARALMEGWREADVAAYARTKEQPYDLTAHDVAAAELAMAGEQLPPAGPAQMERVETVRFQARSVGATSKRADPLAWQPQEDGSWESPSGRKYGPETQVVRRVMALRADMGVDTAAS